MLKAERLGVLLKPEKNHSKFNAGMIKTGDRVQMLYRWSESTKVWTGGKTGLLYKQDFIARAELDTDGRLIKDYDEPFIAPFCDENKSGCQDPRIVPFEGRYYIFYTCWDLNCARVGINVTDDFKSSRHLGIIPTNKWDKDAFILPERVNGKIVYIHRIEPDIQIDYFDSFDDMFNPEYWKSYHEKKHDSVVLKGEQPWENLKVGGSIPPIKTELGWLFIYHGVADDREPFCYRAGAAVLDLENPSKVVARLPYPILEPTEDYEVSGDVDNVVFPQGMYINNGYLYLSYGGADTVVAMCRFDYKELIDELKKHIIQEA